MENMAEWWIAIVREREIALQIPLYCGLTSILMKMDKLCMPDGKWSAWVYKVEWGSDTTVPNCLTLTINA